MLKGTITLREYEVQGKKSDLDITEYDLIKQEHRYTAQGYAFPKDLSLLVNSVSYDSLLLFDVEDRMLTNPSQGRSLKIKPTNVAVESRLDGTPKNRPLPVNPLLPDLLGTYFNYAIDLIKTSAHNVDKTVEASTINYKLELNNQYDKVVPYKQVECDEEAHDKTVEGLNSDETDEEVQATLNAKLIKNVKATLEDNLSIEVRLKRYSHDYDIEYIKVESAEISFELKDVNETFKTYPFIQTSATVRTSKKKLIDRYEPDKVEEVEEEDLNKALTFNFSSEERGTFLTSMDEVVKRHPNKDFSWIAKQNYQMVTDENVQEVVGYLLGFKYLAVDTETTGLRVTFKSMSGVQGPYADQVVGYIFTGKVGEAFFFPLRMNTVPNLSKGDHEHAFDRYIRPLLRIPTIYHNAQFDAKVAFIYGQPTKLKIDTLVAFKDTLGYKNNINVGLKDLSLSILGRDSLELTDLTRSGRYDDANFADVPADLVIAYACPDADNTLMLYEYLIDNQILEKHNAQKVVDIDSQFALAIAYQEFWGMHIDVDRLPDLTRTLKEEMTKHTQIMQNLIKEYNEENMAKGHPEVPELRTFNPNSTQQIMRVAYEYLGIPVKTKLDKKTGLVKPTLDKGARKKLLNELIEGTKHHTFVKAFQDYSDSNTMVKTFTKNLNNIMTHDGYTFTDVNQFLETGRLSTSGPAYQNYSDPVKEFITGRPGYGVSDNDFASIEYKVIAGLSGQDWLIEAFQDPNTDYHKLQAANMHNIAYELVTDTMRQGAKTFNFGIPFGMGDAALGELLTGERSEESTLYASKMKKQYFKGQEKVEEFFQVTRANAIRNEYSSTYFGRRRYYNRAKQSVGTIRRAAGNQPIQGTAADAFKIAATAAYNYIVDKGFMGKILMSGFIHDEMLFEVHDSIHPLEWLKIIKKQSELRIKGFPPFYLGWGYGYNWKQAKSIEVVTELQNHLITVDPWVEYPDWDGDPLKFNNWLKKRIERYEKETIINYITKKEHEEEIMNAVVWGYLTDHIDKNLRSAKLVEQIESFTKQYDIEGYIIPKDPNDEAIKEEAAKAKIEVDNTINDYQEQYHNEYSDYNKERQLRELIERIDVYGSHINYEDKQIYYKPDVNMVNAIKDNSIIGTERKEGVRYFNIYFFDVTTNVIKSTNHYITMDRINYVDKIRKLKYPQVYQQ